MELIATATFTNMAKRLLVLMVLAAMLAATAPAFAQGQVSATGVLLAGLPVDVGTNGTHSITDEASATVYALESETVDLDAYVGQRVTVYGTLTSGEASSDAPGFEGNGTLLSIDVTRVEPADVLPPDPTTVNTRATFDFELTVEGEPPAATRFFGVVPAEGCISDPLSDPDADGVFTGSIDVPRFPPGPVPPEGTEPFSLPVQIVQADGGASPCDPPRVIKDFGIVPANDDTFEARVNFKGGGPVSPEQPTEECLAVSKNPEECEDYVTPGSSSRDGDTDGSSSDGGSPASNGSSGGSGFTSGISTNGGTGSDAESSGLLGGTTGGIRSILPSTGGGMALWVLGAGILLVGSGLLVHRIFR